MSQTWKGDKIVPMTIISAGPAFVTRIKTKEKDGYEGIQIGFGRHLKEFRVAALGDYKVGDEINVSIFKEGDNVKISGLSKGRGFQGVVKRHGFGGGPQTHGQKNRLRAAGSIGATAPQRVIKGRRMAGRMGQERTTIKNTEIVGIDKENNFLMVKGAVPGMKGTLLEIKK